MARRHWLDPIARQLLIASGQLPPAPAAAPAATPAAADPALVDQHVAAEQLVDEPLLDEHVAAVERELLALKLRQDPRRPLQSAAEVADAAALGWRLDVNRAAASDWARLPGLTTAQIDLLVRLQAGGVQLSGPEDLQRLLDLPAAVVASWMPVLQFQWYGEPPAGQSVQRLDLNRAGAASLQQWGLSPERCRRLLGERARRPFRDLADLQQRLQLPPSLVEEWIGKVSFSGGPAGPQLPPAQLPNRSR